MHGHGIDATLELQHRRNKKPSLRMNFLSKSIIVSTSYYNRTNTAILYLLRTTNMTAIFSATIMNPSITTH